MKFNKETRIGLLVGISILVFFAGLAFLRGSNILSSENKYFAYYDNVSGLQPAAAVQIHGFTVGKVDEIELHTDGRVEVTLLINKDTKIPSNTTASLTSLDLLGTKGIALELGNSTTPAQDEQVLQSGVQAGMLDAISSEITPLLRDVRHAIGIVDSILLTVNSTLSTQTRQDLQQSIASLRNTTANFESMSGKINAQGDQLAATIRNTNSITNNLANNNDQINNIINNLDKTTEKLSNAPVDETVAELRSTAQQLDEVMRKLNSGEGSLGMALNDKTLYNELNGTLSNMKTLMADLQKHPSRYINLTIFGRRAKTNTP